MCLAGVLLCADTWTEPAVSVRAILQHSKSTELRTQSIRGQEWFVTFSNTILYRPLFMQCLCHLSLNVAVNRLLFLILHFLWIVPIASYGHVVFCFVFTKWCSYFDSRLFSAVWRSLYFLLRFIPALFAFTICIEIQWLFNNLCCSFSLFLFLCSGAGRRTNCM